MSKTPLEESFNLPPLEQIEKELDQDITEELDREVLEYSEEDTDDEYSDLTPDELVAKMIQMKSESKTITNSDRNLPVEVSNAMADYMKNMDHIHNAALDKFNELSDAILSMEGGQGAKFLAGAVKLLDIARDTQNSTIDRVMKMTKLQMEREEHVTKQEGLVKPPKTISDGVIGGDGDSATQNENVVVSADRNKLMEELRNKQ